MTLAKICGLTTPETLDAALEGGADFVGFVFHPASPRYVTVEQARPLFRQAHGGGKVASRVGKVALLVDASREQIDEIVAALSPDLLQFHGSETPEMLAAAKERYDLPIIKALGVCEASDLNQAAAYEAVTDFLLLDAKPPKGADRTGGHGMAFDWSLLARRSFDKPWFLAGGLNPENVTEAVRISGAPLLDVSSGVESAPGVKDAGLIAAFLEAARRS